MKTPLHSSLKAALVLFVAGSLAACGGSDENATYHEKALESGQRTQHLEEDNISGDRYKNAGDRRATTYNQEDTGLAERKIQPQDSMSVNNKNKGNGQSWQR